MIQSTTDIDSASWVVCRTGPHLCALPLENVVETMRPLPVERIARAPRFVRGLSIIRGVPLPIVDTGSLFGESHSEPQRLVTVRVGDRLIALGVDSVLGVRSISGSASTALPPLLRDADGDVVSAIGILDAELLLFLQTARILPDGLPENLTQVRCNEQFGDAKRC
jgi:purine-binding chemotaxis protein CheW